MTPTIFVDLDETLINCIPDRYGLDDTRRSPIILSWIGSETYWGIVRPTAHELLANIRQIADVKMLTIASRDYACVCNEIFELGFDEDDIFSREDIRESWTDTGRAGAGHYDLVTSDRFDESVVKGGHNVLIDNMPVEYNDRKINALGITKAQYFEVQDFTGHDDDIDTAEFDVIVDTIKRQFAKRSV